MKLSHKGFIGSYEIDEESDLFVGHVLGLDGDGVTFVGRSPKELVQAFRDSVDDYLEFCRELGRPPKKLPSGNLSLRVPPELHQLLLETAQLHKNSVNGMIVEILQKQLHEEFHSH